MTGDDSESEWRRVIARGRLRSAHVAGLAFGLVFGVAMAWLDSPVLYVVAGACLAVSGLAGLLSGGVFFVDSKSWGWMAHAMCLPILGLGIGGLIIGVGRLAGWLD